jgi:nucleoside 2-deoxyribosyltransferase
MKTVFLCTPHKLGTLNYELIERIKALDFNVLCAVTHSPQEVPFAQMFKTNIELIKRANIFVAVLKDYGKDLTAEVGMAYAWGKPSIGINYTANKNDVMCFYALDYIIQPKKLEEYLSKLK